MHMQVIFETITPKSTIAYVFLYTSFVFLSYLLYELTTLACIDNPLVQGVLIRESHG